MSALTPARPFELPGLRSSLTRGRVARAIVKQVVAGVPVRVVLPDGESWGAGDAHDPTVPVLEIRRPDAFFRRLEQHPKIGLGEAYMAGEWRVAPGTDLAQALIPFAARLAGLVPRPLLAVRGLVDRRLPEAERNTVDGAKANIEAHYDLSNEMFATFLDPTMTYSSALFDMGSRFAEQSLEDAQVRKIDAVLDAGGVGAGSRVLEVGTGWGALAIRAAGRGAQVTSLTLSRAQREWAMTRVAEAGVEDLVDIRLQDYREVTGEFDAVVSVEMIEAVGEEYWPEYFTVLDRVLAPGGTVVIQAILMDHHRLLATRNSYGWIQKHIFPGGLIPSATAIREVLAEHTDLSIVQTRHFGLHYAETLHRWRLDFLAHQASGSAPHADETFTRMWEYYLAYCEAGFATGYLDVAHLTLRSNP